jgi:hypothetical protein
MLVEDFTFEVLNENHCFLDFDCDEHEINDFVLLNNAGSNTDTIAMYFDLKLLG